MPIALNIITTIVIYKSSSVRESLPESASPSSSVSGDLEALHLCPFFWLAVLLKDTALIICLKAGDLHRNKLSTHSLGACWGPERSSPEQEQSPGMMEDNALGVEEVGHNLVRAGPPPPLKALLIVLLGPIAAACTAQPSGKNLQNTHHQLLSAIPPRAAFRDSAVSSLSSDLCSLLTAVHALRPHVSLAT